MEENKLSFNQDTVKHLAKKVVDTIPSGVSDVKNDSDFITKSYTDRKIKNMKIPNGVDKSIIDDKGLSGSRTWSSKKIEDRALEFQDLMWQEVEGVNPTVENSKIGYMKEVEIFGNTWQDKDSKNLFDGEFELGQYESSGLEIQNDNMVRNKNKFIPIKPNTQYTLSATKGGESLRYMTFEYDEKKKGIQILATKTFRTHANARYLNFEITSLIEGDIKIQLEEGLEATSYEPYHKADLSDIRHVGEYDEESGKYKVEVGSCGRNLWDPNVMFNIEGYSSGIYRSKQIKLKPNTNYIISANEKEILPSSIIVALRVDKEETGSVSGLGYPILNNNISEKTQFTTPKNGLQGFAFNVDIDRKYENTQNGLDTIKKYFDIQLEEGLSPTQYEPYKSNKQTLLLPCQLSKVGDVQDRLYWNGKKYVIEKNVGRVDISKSNAYLSRTLDNHVRIWVPDNKIPHIKQYGKCLVCNQFRQEKLIGVVNKEGIDYTNGFDIQIEKSKLEEHNINGFYKWLEINPTYVLAPLKTSQLIETDITEEIFPSTFKDKTHFFVNGGKMIPKIKCKVPVSAGGVITTLTQETAVLRQEIEQTKEKNKTQDKTIINNMLSIDDILTSTVSLVSTLDDETQVECKNIVKLYEKMIEMGLVDQVPLIYRNLILK